LQPDILLVYHNVNDAWTCQMVDGFRSDYSHSRRVKPWTAGWVNRIPQVLWLGSYQLLRDRVARKWGKASGLLFWISDLPWQTSGEFRGEAVEVFRRNVSNLVRAAQAASCLLVLIKWECDWGRREVPPYLERSPSSTETYYAYLRANNEALQRIAADCDPCHFVDLGRFEPIHFSDGMHFSPSGLDEMARRVAEAVEPMVRSVVELWREKGRALDRTW
jgi:hypothetical protein